MNKSAIFKTAGIVIISFLVILVGIFFLFPYLNEEKYEEVQKERLLNSPAETSGSGQSSTESNLTGGGQLEYLQEELSTQNEQDNIWKNRYDSLSAVNQKLEHERDSVLTELTTLKEWAESDELGEAELITASDESQEAFSERVKSLLNLDEEELEPIANQMSHTELVKIYKNSSNMQREKLLRSLSPERAAKLIKEVML